MTTMTPNIFNIIQRVCASTTGLDFSSFLRSFTCSVKKVSSVRLKTLHQDTESNIKHVSWMAASFVAFYSKQIVSTVK